MGEGVEWEEGEVEETNNEGSHPTTTIASVVRLVER